MQFNRIATALGALALITGAASAQTINTTDRGWYNEFGLHQTTNDNYVVGAADSEGGSLFRNFFVFDIPTLSGSDYTSAILRLYNPASLVGVTETFELWSYEGDIAKLVDGTGGPAAVEDLGDGTVLGTVSIDTAVANVVEISLNSAGLAAVNAKKGQQIAFGGTLTNLSEGADVYAFGFSGNNPANPADGDSTLVLTSTGGTNGGGEPVPEPGEWAAMGILGAGLAGLVLRKRRAN